MLHRRRPRGGGIAPVLAGLAGCAPAPAEIPADQDIHAIDVALDVAELEGTATLRATPSTAEGGLSLDVRGLTIDEVRLDGFVATPSVDDGRLFVTAGGPEVEVAVDYHFQARGPESFDGWMPDLGVSFQWPSHCGNLFPCDPSPAEGAVYGWEISGTAGELDVIAPTSTHGAVPAYAAGFAVGLYEEIDLGSTPAGTRVEVRHFPGSADAALSGTEHLLAAMAFFEDTYGPYAFGPRFMSVEVDWGADSYGGMEHHPFVHVARFDFGSTEAQVHEAAHGWFGDGVRIRCWEDYVVSEGTTTWATARALDAVAGLDLWPYYTEGFLEPICDGLDSNAVSMPGTCTMTEPDYDQLGGLAAYMKGACFYAEVAQEIGAEALDAVLASVYRQAVGQAIGMVDVLDAIHEVHPAHRARVEDLANDWLRQLACPTDAVQRCFDAGTTGGVVFEW